MYLNHSHNRQYSASSYHCRVANIIEYIHSFHIYTGIAFALYQKTFGLLFARALYNTISTRAPIR